MPSAINGNVPVTNSDLVSASVRFNFATAQSEITALQNQLANVLSQTGGTIYNPNAVVTTPPTNPLTIRNTIHNYARIGYVVDGVADQWYAGVGPGGHFTIGDLLAIPAYRLDIDPTGWARINGSLTVGNALANMGAGTVNATAYYVNGSPFTGGTTYTATAPVILTGNAFGLAASAAMGNWTNADITVDGFGRVTAAANGTAGGGSFLPLAGGTIRDPTPVGTHDTGVLKISAVSGTFARIGYNVDGVADQWYAGVGSGGHFTIGDNLAVPAYRLDIDPTGWTRINGSLTVGSALTNTGPGTVNATAYYVNGAALSAGGLPLTGGGLSNDTTSTIMTLTNAGGTHVPQVRMRSSNGSLAAPTTITGNIQLGIMAWDGWNGTAYSGGANIQCMSAAGVTWNTGNAPTRMIFQTTKVNGGLPSLSMQIGSLGGLIVGNPAGSDQGAGSVNAENFYTPGTLYINGVSLEDYIKAVVGI